MTYRERRERRADRLRGWADKREQRSDAARAADERIGSMIPLGQPILVGHHSQRRAERDRDRMIGHANAALEHGRKADEFRSKADNIDAAADRAIYSDDDDAIEKLHERIEALGGERERIKAYNASCRKGARDVSLLDAAQQKQLASVASVCPYQLGKNGAAPAYWLSNLSGNIGRQRKRLASIERANA